MKIIFFAASDSFLYNFCLGLARFLRNQGGEVVMMSSGGDYGALIEEEGFRWIPLPMNRRSINPFKEFCLFKFLLNIYKEEQPDTVHNFTLKSVIYGGLAAQAAGIKNRINTVPGLGYVFSSQSVLARALRPLLKVLLRLALRGDSSRLIVQNPDDRQLFLASHLIRSNNIHLIKGAGVDTAYFSAATRQRGKKRGKKFKVLLASRLLWEKGVGIYAEAAELLAHRANEIEFLLAGVPDAGNPGSIAEDDVKRWQKSGNLQILGYVNDMCQIFNEVDLVVLPSYREGVPQVLIEAAAMSLPLITTDAPGCREIVADGINGFLIPIKNAPALADRIAHLLDHPALCEKFGQAGREKVLKEFDQQLVLRQTESVYRSLGTAF